MRTLTLNQDVSSGSHTSLISYQQCGNFLYFFKVKVVEREDDQIVETQPTDISASPANGNSNNSKFRKAILSLCYYDMSMDSADQEPVVC